MILWVVLFFLVIAISFVLALQSMKDYQEIPLKSKEQYALYLIRKTDRLNSALLDSMRQAIISGGLIISLERLFKGKQAALTIFGPKKILEKFNADLNLLELEDYSLSLDGKDILTWEVGAKNNKEANFNQLGAIFKNLPTLMDDEQFLWQMVLGAKGSEAFQTQIRAAVYTKDAIRRKELLPLLHNLTEGKLVKIPRPFTPEQMLSFYRLRSLGKDSLSPVMESEAIVRLLKV